MISSLIDGVLGPVPCGYEALRYVAGALVFFVMVEAVLGLFAQVPGYFRGRR